MDIITEPFSLPKAGSSDEEYEDACCPTEKYIYKDVVALKFAVADGATETSFSGLWAKMLVNAYCDGQFTTTKKIVKSLLRLQKIWFEQVNTKSLPWFAEEKLRNGAFSSILGLTINSPTSGGEDAPRWQSLAIGDSCFFQVRHDTLITSFPFNHSTQFNNRPSLLSSNPSHNEDIKKYAVQKKGQFNGGDTFYLMTDALACWFLNAVECKEKPWEVLRDLGTDEAIPFSDWIGQLRKDGQIRNDDVTLLRIDII